LVYPHISVLSDAVFILGVLLEVWIGQVPSALSSLSNTFSVPPAASFTLFAGLFGILSVVYIVVATRYFRAAENPKHSYILLALEVLNWIFFLTAFALLAGAFTIGGDGTCKAVSSFETNANTLLSEIESADSGSASGDTGTGSFSGDSGSGSGSASGDTGTGSFSGDSGSGDSGTAGTFTGTGALPGVVTGAISGALGNLWGPAETLASQGTSRKRALYGRQIDIPVGEAFVSYGNKLIQACQFHDAAIAMAVIAWLLWTVTLIVAAWRLWEAYSAKVSASAGDSAEPAPTVDFGVAEKRKYVGVNDVNSEDNGARGDAAV